MRAGWRRPRSLSWAALGLLGLGIAPARAQYGLALSGVGPINRSMGGASTAAPIDANGALYWNPATIGGLGRSEMDFGLQLLIPRTSLTSRVPAGALGNGQPGTTLADKTGSNNGVFPLPAFGLVYRPDKDSAWTYGLGIWTVGGFVVNYPASRTNPILMPQFGFGQSVPGVGALYTQYQLIQFAPSVAYQLTDTLALGFSGNIDMGFLQANPGLFTQPALVIDPRLSGPFGPGTPGPAYPPATDGRARAGGGFNVGLYYTPEDSPWSFGASWKSPQWFDTYHFNAVSALGQPLSPQFRLNFPWIASVGTSYEASDRLLIAADLRYLDYRDTDGFRHGGFDDRGALRGLGWQSVFAVAAGVQYLLTDSLTVRGGYTFALNPVGGQMTTFNIGSPTIIQHSLALGVTYALTERFRVSVTWSHDFQNSVQGPLIQPFAGPILGSLVKSSATADSVVLGASVAF